MHRLWLVLLLHACGRIGFDTDVGPDGGASGPRLIQQRTNSAGTGTPLAITLSPPPVPGDLLVMVGAGVNRNLSGVTGGGVPMWSRAAYSTVNSNIEIWYGVTDGSGAMVAISLSGNGSNIWMNVSEWSGLARSDVLDGASAQYGTTSPASAPPILTSHARDLLIFGTANHLPNTFGVPTPETWTPLDDALSVDFGQSAWYRVTTIAGTQEPQVTETAHEWEAAIAAFKAER